MTRIGSADRRFVESLESLRDSGDRAALAHLRRGLGRRRGLVAEMCPYVVPWLGARANRRREDSYFTVASLFASHPKPGGRGSLGSAFAVLRGIDAARGESVERRLVALLNCHEEELPGHLRHAVSLLKARDVPVDWAQLLADVQMWGHEDRFVQKWWARDYWGHLGGQAMGEVAAVATESEEAGG